MKPLNILILWFIFQVSLLHATCSNETAAHAGDTRGIYLPPQHFNMKWLKETAHYYKFAGLNAVVIHAKTPRGRVLWNSSNPTARKTGAACKACTTERSVAFFKKEGIRTIAKIDIFIDSRLAEKIPEYGLVNKTTKGAWSDKNGLKWVNPYDMRVWKYNIDLAKELAEMGFDEIQFDYARFPSDGKLDAIIYPLTITGVDRAGCLERFFQFAHGELKPLGVDISVDLFGLTAWKKDDFGVGQVLERIAPYVDIVCPMLYPSHFPRGFLGWKSPSEYPRRIVEMSMDQMLKRTSKPIRPWLQAFNYTSPQIDAQITGVENSGINSWMAWNASANYSSFYKTMEIRSGVRFPELQFYPDLNALRSSEEKILMGRSRIINFTDYNKGITVISLERSSPYSTLISVIQTMDEAILDAILRHREIHFGKHTHLYTKALKVSRIFSREIGTPPKKITPGPAYIDWLNNGSFSKKLPKELKQKLIQLKKDAPRTTDTIMPPKKIKSGH